MNRNVLTLGLLALIALTGGIIVNQLSILRSSNLTSISPASQQAAVSDFNSSLVAHYTFDDTANDASGNGHHTTLVRASYTNAKIGRGVAMNNVATTRDTRQYVTLPSSLPTLSDFTFSAWVYLDTITGSPPNAPVWAKNSSQVFMLRSASNYININGKTDQNRMTPSNTGNWVHFVITKNGNTANYYRN